MSSPNNEMEVFVNTQERDIMKILLEKKLINVSKHSSTDLVLIIKLDKKDERLSNSFFKYSGSFVKSK